MLLSCPARQNATLKVNGDQIIWIDPGGYKIVAGVDIRRKRRGKYISTMLY